MKPFQLILCLLLFALLLCSCSKKEPESQAVSTDIPTDLQSTEVSVFNNDKTTSSPTTIVETANATTVTQTEQKFEKQGDMIFTDSPENKFITAVSAKYNTNVENLACLYTTTNEDRNYVWQFKDTKDTNGKVIKNADTLLYVYIVSQDCATIKRTGGFTGNENISTVEGYVVFQAAKQMQIPQNQQQLYS